MATTRLIPMHKIKKQSIAYTVRERINYAVNPTKTLGGELVTAYGCDPATAANEMLLAKRAYADFTGKEILQSDVLLYQIRQSFKPGEVTPEQAQQIGYELAMKRCRKTKKKLCAKNNAELLSYDCPEKSTWFSSDALSIFCLPKSVPGECAASSAKELFRGIGGYPTSNFATQKCRVCTTLHCLLLL